MTVFKVGEYTPGYPPLHKCEAVYNVDTGLVIRDCVELDTDPKAGYVIVFARDEVGKLITHNGLKVHRRIDGWFAIKWRD